MFFQIQMPGGCWRLESETGAMRREDSDRAHSRRQLSLRPPQVKKPIHFPDLQFRAETACLQRS